MHFATRWKPGYPLSSIRYNKDMSLLFFSHEKESVALITDTLSTRPDGSPLFFVNKVFSYPTLSMVMAVTGVYQLGLRWNEALLERIAVIDIDNLDIYATDQLRQQWADLHKQENIPGSITCTIYHFGWSESDKQYVRYAYRSDNGFVSERHVDVGAGVKPHPKDIDDLSKLSPFDLAKLIKNEQDTLPHGEKLYIGGNLVLTFMNQDVGIQSRIIHKFEDYEDHWQKMNTYFN